MIPLCLTCTTCQWQEEIWVKEIVEKVSLPSVSQAMLCLEQPPGRFAVGKAGYETPSHSPDAQSEEGWVPHLLWREYK
ncbi:uncharacterized [Tachysurus ichikawai]